MHHAVARRAVDQEEVVAAGCRPEQRVPVRRHLVQSGPGGLDVGCDIPKDRHPAVSHRGDRFDPFAVQADIEGATRYARRGPEKEDPAIANPKVEAVAGKDRHGHHGREQAAGYRRGNLPSQRRHRQRHVEPLSKLGGPGTGGVHDGVSCDPAAGSLHRDDPFAGLAGQPGDLDAPLRPHSHAESRGQISVQHLKRSDEAVAGAEGSAHHFVADRRVEPADILDSDLARLVQTLRVLHLEPGPQHSELCLARGQPEIAGLQVARIGPELLLKATQLSPARAARAER